MIRMRRRGWRSRTAPGRRRVLRPVHAGDGVADAGGACRGAASGDAPGRERTAAGAGRAW